MRRILTIVLLAVLVLALLPAAQNGADQLMKTLTGIARADDAVVSITADNFAPTDTPISVGNKVTFKNITDSQIMLSSKENLQGFPKTIATGQSVDVQFPNAGTFTFTSEVGKGAKHVEMTVRVATTPAPTAVPTTAAPSVPTGCPTTGRVKDMVKLDIVREGTEVPGCAFEWRGIPNSSDVTVPTGVIATLHLADRDRIVVVDGDQSANTGDTKAGTTNVYVIKAGTFRVKAGYPKSDAVWNSCALLQKEQNFAGSEDPTFGVNPSNFTCNGTTNPTPVAGGSGSGSNACANRNPNGDLSGVWTFKSGNKWELTGGNATIKGAQGWTVHTPNFPGDPGLPTGQTETTNVATAYCK